MPKPTYLESMQFLFVLRLGVIHSAQLTIAVNTDRHRTMLVAELTQ